MIGLPFETPQMLAKTIRLADTLNPTELSWKYYTPERGTALFPVLEEHNLPHQNAILIIHMGLERP